MSVNPLDGLLPAAGPFVCLDPEHALSLMSVYRTVCTTPHADALLPELTRALSGMLNGLPLALLVREDDGFCVAGGASLAPHVHNALGDLADAGSLSEQTAEARREGRPLHLELQGANWQLYPMWADRAPEPVGALLVAAPPHEEGRGMFAYLRQLTSDLAPTITGALERRELAQQVEHLRSEIEEQSSDLEAGQRVIDNLDKKMRELEASVRGGARFAQAAMMIAARLGRLDDFAGSPVADGLDPLTSELDDVLRPDHEEAPQPASDREPESAEKPLRRRSQA